MVHDLSAGSDGGARAVARRCAAPREKRHRARFWDSKAKNIRSTMFQ